MKINYDVICEAAELEPVTVEPAGEGFVVSTKAKSGPTLDVIYYVWKAAPKRGVTVKMKSGRTLNPGPSTALKLLDNRPTGLVFFGIAKETLEAIVDSAIANVNRDIKKKEKHKAEAPARKKEAAKYAATQHKANMENCTKLYGKGTWNRVTYRQEDGDDGYQYVVRVDGRAVMNGLDLRGAQYEKERQVDAIAKKEKLGKYAVNEGLIEGRRHVYGPGDEALISHPNKTMQAIGKGKEVKVTSSDGSVAKIEKVQFFNGGTMYKLDRKIGSSFWVSDRDVKLTEGWMNHKGGKFTADMSDIQTHAFGTGKDVHCPGCKKKLFMDHLKPQKDKEGEVTHWTHHCEKCGADLTVFNEAKKLTFKQFLLSEAKGKKDPDVVKPHKYSVKLLSKGKGQWPTLKGEIYEKDVMIGTFTRGAVRDGYIPPIEYKFKSSQAKARFDDFADSLSIEETIEALLP